MGVKIIDGFRVNESEVDAFKERRKRAEQSTTAGVSDVSALEARVAAIEAELGIGRPDEKPDADEAGDESTEAAKKRPTARTVEKK